MKNQRQLNQRMDEDTMSFLDDIQAHYNQKFADVTMKFALVASIRAHHAEIFPHEWKDGIHCPEKRKTA